MMEFISNKASTLFWLYAAFVFGLAAAGKVPPQEALMLAGFFLALSVWLEALARFGLKTPLAKVSDNGGEGP